MATTSCPSDLNEVQWALVGCPVQPSEPNNRPRQTDKCAVVNAILRLLRIERSRTIAGFAGIAERTRAWLGRYPRFTEDFDDRLQTSAALIDIAAIRSILNRPAPDWPPHAVFERTSC
ncbi:MAG: hypothetical protein ACR2RE_20675 [Geminicoccaceae bacterium]